MTVPVISQALDELNLLPEPLRKSLVDKYGVNASGSLQTRVIVTSGAKPDPIYPEFRKIFEATVSVLAQALNGKKLLGQSEFDQELK